MEYFRATDGIFNTFFTIKILIRLELFLDSSEDIFSLGHKFIGEVEVSRI
jgi:hypothetical protein